MKRIFKGDFKVTQIYNSKHGGIDIVGMSDKNVICPVEGTVRSSTIIMDKSNLTWEWGNYVRVDDKSGNRYYFCHLKSRKVFVGDKVKPGEVIGIMGNTGKSFGAHCHFETRTKNNQRTNPADFLELPNEKGVYKWNKGKYGAFKNRWGFIDGRWYYFDEKGHIAKGFKTIGGKIYFFASTGELIITDNKGEIT